MEGPSLPLAGLARRWEEEALRRGARWFGIACACLPLLDLLDGHSVVDAVLAGARVMAGRCFRAGPSGILCPCPSSPRSNTPATAYTSLDPPVDARRMRSPTAAPRSAASSRPITQAVPVGAKRPAIVRRFTLRPGSRSPRRAPR